MKKIIYGILLGTMMIVLISCYSGQPASPPLFSVPERGDGFQELSRQSLEKQLSALEILDYADILAHSSNYDEETVVVVGKISKFSSSPYLSFCFHERANGSFDINLSERTPSGESYFTVLRESYSVGDYVIVQGIWSHERFGDPFLNNATILANGSIAQQYYDLIQKNWYNTREELSQTLPLTHSMEITSNPERYIGHLVRTAGKIENLSDNYYYSGISFYFYNPKIDSQRLDINMWGLPNDMQKQCAEDEYIVISGIVQEKPSGSYVLLDCFVECTGAEAETAFQALEEEQYTLRDTQKDAYVSQCIQYTYEQIARHPNDYVNIQAQVSGTVLSVSYGLEKIALLLDTGIGNLMVVHYTGHYSRDPLILQGDYLTFWGIHQGQIYTSDMQDNDRYLPLFSALYCSITE